MSKSKSLGILLREAREVNKLSLRDVEEITKISNAYLSQLENDIIKSPSANFLYKLANLYGIKFESLMEYAGIIQTDSEQTQKKNLNSSALYSTNLTIDEENELIKYLSFLRFRNKKQRK